MIKIILLPWTWAADYLCMLYYKCVDRKVNSFSCKKLIDDEANFSDQVIQKSQRNDRK